jgi:flagellar hook-basal body complex protein FliE
LINQAAQVAMLPLQTVSTTPKQASPASGTELSQQFGDFLSNSLNQLSAQQAESDKLAEQFVKGEVTDTHQVMIAAEKVSLGLEMAVQTRNKVIEAYQDIMRMQI